MAGVAKADETGERTVRALRVKVASLAPGQRFV